MNKDIRAIVRGVYDLQKLRIQMGNRIVGNYKAKMGQEPGQTEEEAFDHDEKAKEVLQVLRKSWKKIADGVAKDIKTKKSLSAMGPLEVSGQKMSYTPDEKLILEIEAAKQVRTAAQKALKYNEFKGDQVISEYSEFVLVSQYIAMEKQEMAQFSQLEAILGQERLYMEFLSKVKGCGPAMSGVILSELDITKAEYPSSLCKYLGLDVVMTLNKDTGEEVWEGRSRKKHHLVPKNYIDKDGKEAVRDGITFNPWAKTKLIGVLGPSFLRAGRENNPYAEAYYNYKARLQNMPAHAEKSKKHIHAMSIRFCVKRFLVDLYKFWRALEGLPVAEEYSIAKLGMVHKKAA